MWVTRCIFSSAQLLLEVETKNKYLACFLDSLGICILLVYPVPHCFLFSSPGIFNFLPLLYSIVSFFGVLTLLVCTPLGFARLFTIVGELVIRPTFLRNLDDDYFKAKFEEDSLRQKVEACKGDDTHMQQ